MGKILGFIVMIVLFSFIGLVFYGMFQSFDMIDEETDFCEEIENECDRYKCHSDKTIEISRKMYLLRYNNCLIERQLELMEN